VSRRSLLQRADLSSVAVFRALHLGEMLCSVPALRTLRATLPRTHIALVGLPESRQFADRFAGYVDEFIPFPGHPLLPEQPVQEHALTSFYNGVCARRFTLAIQLHGNDDVSNDIVGSFGADAMAGFCHGKPVSHGHTVLCPYPGTGAEPERLQALMVHLGAEPAGMHLEFPLSSHDEEELRSSDIGRKLEPGQYLCIHPGARTRNKCWPARHFAEVGDRLAEEFGLQVVLTGSAQEADVTAEVAAHMRHEPIDAAVPISLGAMAVLLRGARLLLCNDTGVSHIAAGLKVKSVVVFSKADIARRAPLDRLTHRCIWDPGAERAKVVLEHARALLSDMAPSRQRSVGMWPYW
jgi:ADP-heptose:LPS heptosyltransferase